MRHLPYLLADQAELVQERLLLAHDYLGFKVQHADDFLATVANSLAVEARIVLADSALTVYLFPCDKRLADSALP